MKLLTEPELLAVLPAEAGDARAALCRFDDVLPSDLRDPGVCLRAYLEDVIQGSTVFVNGEKAHVLFHHRTFDGGLYIDLAQTIRPSGGVAEIFAGVERLAQNLGAKYVLFATVRRGLCATAQRLGYTVQSVNLLKGL